MRITIGIPCFRGVEAETLEDYMRFAYYLGRRYTEHEFFLAIKSKSEQFRARNSIVEAALQIGSDYLLMLDDDHVIDWTNKNVPNDSYEFLRKLLAHAEDPKVGIVGALYYQRGGDCRPVVMTKYNDGFRFLRDDEILNKVQEVDVAGGGCILVNCKIFDRIPQPYFQPENQFGTDIQICKLAKEHGFSVLVDTSLVIGHVMNQRSIVTPRTRYRHIASMSDRWKDISGGVGDRLGAYRIDAEEYSGMKMEDMEELGLEYRENMKHINNFKTKEEYYASLGIGQLGRQVHFHHKKQMVEWDEFLLSVITNNRPWKILDYGCGSAPATFELLKRGHYVDFVDVDGAGAYEFLKWRVKKNGLTAHAGWKMNGEYDFAIFSDSLEHLENWRDILQATIDSLVKDGILLTNYWLNADFSNPEHVSMDHDAVKEFLTSNGMYPINNLIWTRMNVEEKAA